MTEVDWLEPANVEIVERQDGYWDIVLHLDGGYTFETQAARVADLFSRDLQQIRRELKAPRVTTPAKARIQRYVNGELREG